MAVRSNKEFLLIFGKAFDTIDHYILIKELKLHKFTPNSIELMKAYLFHRSQFVKLEEEVSTQRKVSIGVPQGAVLRLILFFTNNLIKSATEQNTSFLLTI